MTPIQVTKDADAREYVVKGVAYHCNRLDAHGDWVSRADLRRAVHESAGELYVDVMHSGKRVGQAKIVESYLVEDGQGGTWGDVSGQPVEVRPGDWVAAVKLPPDLFELVESGQLNAFSFMGWAIPRQVADR